MGKPICAAQPQTDPNCHIDNSYLDPLNKSAAEVAEGENFSQPRSSSSRDMNQLAQLLSQGASGGKKIQ